MHDDGVAHSPCKSTNGISANDLIVTVRKNVRPRMADIFDNLGISFEETAQKKGADGDGADEKSTKAPIRKLGIAKEEEAKERNGDKECSLVDIERYQ